MSFAQNKHNQMKWLKQIKGKHADYEKKCACCRFCRKCSLLQQFSNQQLFCNILHAGGTE